MDQTSTRERILEAGLREFSVKGFQKASLRSIATAAGVTTGAIYGCFADKDALFAALVEPAATQLQEQFAQAQSQFWELSEAEQIAAMNGYSRRALQSMLDFIYGHFYAFRLIVCHSAGTRYGNYVEEMVEIETESTIRYAEMLRRNGHYADPLPDNLVHILSSAYFSAIFETVAHNMAKPEADAYVARISAFFSAGWRCLFRV